MDICAAGGTLYMKAAGARVGIVIFSKHGGCAMTLQIGDTAPDFEADTTQGHIRFHDWIGDSWVVLFSHPKDFTPVCTTELGALAHMEPEFRKRNTKVIGLSIDPVDDHHRWSKDITEVTGATVNYP